MNRNLKNKLFSPWATREYTYRDLLKGDDKEYLRKADRVKELPGSIYQEIDPKTGTITFNTKSSQFAKNGKTWTQMVQLTDLPNILEDKEIKVLDAVRVALSDGDVKVYCNCEAFLYWGWKYITSELEVIIGEPEKRSPTIRNPDMKGTVCKHLHQVLRVLPFNATSMAKDLNRV